MEALPGIWSLTPIGGLIGAVIALYWLLGTGRLISKSSHERELAQANKRGDEWKETVMVEREVNREIRRQNSMLIEASRTATDFFGKVSTDVDDTGDPNVAS